MPKPTLRQADIDLADLLVRIADDIEEPIEPEYRALAKAPLTVLVARTIDSAHAEVAPLAMVGLGKLESEQSNIDQARHWYTMAIDSGHAAIARPAEEAAGVLDQSDEGDPIFEHLLELFREVMNARAAMTDARQAQSGSSCLIDAPRTRLLMALEAYAAELEAQKLPLPYGIRDDLRIQRGILGRVSVDDHVIPKG